MTASEPHAAFPSFPPSSGTYGSTSRSGPSKLLTPIPTSEEIRTLIGQSNSLYSIRFHLIRALERVAGSEDHGALLQMGEDLDVLPDADWGGLSAALVYILTARLNKANESGKPDLALLALCIRFASNFDVDQLRLCLRRVSILSWALLRHAQICKKVDQVLQPLYNLATRPAPSGSMIGSQAAFLEACLLTRTYQGVSPIIQETYTDFKTGECTYLDVITFYHHAGLISAAQRDFTSAKQLYSVAVTVPAQSPSAIQLAAAKRAILCELLSTGKQLHFPNTTSSSVVRAIEKNASEYTNLSKSFGDQRWDAVYRQATEGKKVWDQDCNAGLVQQVIDSVVKRKILKIKGLYSRLTVDQLLAKVAGDQPMTSSDIVNVLLGMRSTGEINVTISDTIPQVVTFPEDTIARGDAALAQLSQSRGLASFLEVHLTGTGKQLGLDPKYLKKQAGLSEMAGSKPPGRGGRGGTDEVDLMIAAEERGGPGHIGGSVRGVGSNLSDMGF